MTRTMGAYLLTIANNENGELIHVDSVPNGKNCKCLCPHCKSPLVAKNRGKKRIHHFAHEHNQDCKACFETTIHKLAKDIIKEAAEIMLPSRDDLFANKEKPTGSVKLTDVCVEKWDEQLKIKPDVEGVMENGQKLLIEILVSHKVDERKAKIIVDNNLLCVEIDVSKQKMDKDALRKFLLESTSGRQWIGWELNDSEQEVVQEIQPETLYNPYYYIPPKTFNPYYNDVLRNIVNRFADNELALEVCGKKYYILGYKNVSVKASQLFPDIALNLLIQNGADGNYIAFSVRGRCRNKNAVQRIWEHKNLKVIDVIIKDYDDKLDFQNIEYLSSKYNIWFYNFVEENRASDLSKYFRPRGGNSNYYYDSFARWR